MVLFGGESLVELLAPQDGEKILDLGCGTESTEGLKVVFDANPKDCSKWCLCARY